MEPMGAKNTNEAFVNNLREYPGEKYPKNKKEWQSVQGGSILTICKLHPSQRPPMVRPEDDNEVCDQPWTCYVPPPCPRTPSRGTDAPPHPAHTAALSCTLRALPCATPSLHAPPFPHASPLPRAHIETAVRLCCGANSLGRRTSSSSSRTSSRMGSRWSRRRALARTRCLRAARTTQSSVRQKVSRPTTSTARGRSMRRPSACERGVLLRVHFGRQGERRCVWTGRAWSPTVETKDDSKWRVHVGAPASHAARAAWERRQPARRAARIPSCVQAATATHV